MKLSSNRLSQAVRLFAVLAFVLAAFFPVFAQTASPVPSPATVTTLAFYDNAAQADKDVVSSSRVLSDSGKWLSAWKLLADYDVANANPYILAEKIRIADEGFAQSLMHLVFGFVDLKDGEDLATLRAGQGEGIDSFDFKPADLAAAIEISGAAIPPILSMALGDYYYEVWTRYKGQWMEEDAAILGKSAEQYDRALAYETYTPASLGKQSEILIALSRFDAAEIVVKKGLELDPANHQLALSLGSVLYGAGRFAEIYPIADRLIANPNDPNELNDAFILGIKAGLGSGDKEALGKYLDAYEASFKGEFMPGLVRHLVMVKMGDAQAADAVADVLYDAFPGNPEVIRSVLSSWLSVNDSTSGLNFLDRCLKKNPSDEAAGALYFYRALLGYQAAMSLENIETALADMTVAEDHFNKAYKPENEVFATIAQLKDEWTQALNSAKKDEAYSAVSVPTTGDATQPAVPAAPAVPADAGADTTSAASAQE